MPADSPQSHPPAQPRPRWQRILFWTGATLLLLAVALAITVGIVLNRAEPFLRARVVNTLASRFDANVQLDQFAVSTTQGFAITGGGLRITLPPSADRKGMFGASASGQKSHRILDNKLYVDEIVSHDAVLTLMPGNPAKQPLVFSIHKLHLTASLTRPSMHYTATLTIPTPRGEITSEGEFGPWVEEDPRTTPISGNYSFDHADLSTIKGIAGILSSTGKLSGPLDHLTVDGTTTTPDFRVAESGHPVALFTQFHAIVDGTTGDTYLQPVQAHFRNTWFTCQGSIVRIPQMGHRILLQITMTHARIEDLLWLAVKSEPPVITGAVRLNTGFDLPPDPSHTLTVAHRLGLNGNFIVTGVRFSNPATETKIDSISLRTQGNPRDANSLKDKDGRIIADEVNIPATLSGNFTLQRSLLNLDPGEFKVPGLDATFTGSYSLDGQRFDFSGNAKLDATVSQMFTGWRSFLLKPFDPMFKKHGAGTYIPFHVGGTKEAPKFGLELRQH